MKRVDQIKYYLVKNNFHGGGIVSQHDTQEEAEQARNEWIRGSNCPCGCCEVVCVSDYDSLPAYNPDDPYYTICR